MPRIEPDRSPLAGRLPPAGGVGLPALIHLRRAKDLIDRHYAEPLDLAAMAQEAGFSRYHFARAFRVAYGDTPGAYLCCRRIERAKDLLRAANLTVTEICTLVGFSSLGSFSSRFREIVGISPSAYRAQHRQQGGAPAVPGCFVMMWSHMGSPPGRDTATSEKPDPSAAG